MANHENLPVYRESYALTLDLFLFIRKFPREYKYTLGEGIKKEAVKMIMNIYHANCSIRERKKRISSARESLEVIRLLLRLSQDLKLNKLEKFALTNVRIASVKKQLIGWEKRAGVALYYGKGE